MWNFLAEHWFVISGSALLATALVLVWVFMLKPLVKRLSRKRRERHEQRRDEETTQVNRKPVLEQLLKRQIWLMTIAILLLIVIGGRSMFAAYKAWSGIDVCLSEIEYVKERIAKIAKIGVPTEAARPEPSTPGFNAVPSAFDCSTCEANTDTPSAPEDNVWTGVFCEGAPQCKNCVVDCTGVGDFPICGRCHSPK